MQQGPGLGYHWTMRLSRVPLLVILVSLLMVPLRVAISEAQEASEVPVVADEALTPSQKKELQEQIDALSLVLHPEPAKQASVVAVPAPAVSQPVAKKRPTPDDVERALNTFSGLVTSIAVKLEKEAPRIWDVMIRRQYSNALSMLIVPGSLVLICLSLVFVLGRTWRPEAVDRDSQFAKLWVAYILPTVGSIIAAIWFVVQLSFAVELIVNPEFGAVRDVITMMVAPGSL